MALILPFVVVTKSVVVKSRVRGVYISRKDEQLHGSGSQSFHLFPYTVASNRKCSSSLLQTGHAAISYTTPSEEPPWRIHVPAAPGSKSEEIRTLSHNVWQ